MTGLQKFIKYAAIAFGIYLSTIIILVFFSIAKEFVETYHNTVTNIIKEDREYNKKDKKYNNRTDLEFELNT